jgi:radical SAM protein with 4Fe4S-binding SPASM domain
MVIKKIIYRISKSLREIYYSYYPDRDFLSLCENNLVWCLRVETCNICNANCIFCAYQYQKRKKRIMSEKMFNKTIEDYSVMGGGNLMLIPVAGDPLIDPFILSRIHYARQFPNIKTISTITNCINLHEVGTKNLLTSGLNSIIVSTSGFDLELHEKIYRSKKAERMKSNLIDLLIVNRELGYPCEIKIGLRTCQSLKEVMSDKEFREIVKLSDEVDINYYFEDWSGAIKQSDLLKGMKLRPFSLLVLRRKAPCWMLYGSLHILSDGTVAMCGCQELEGDSDLVLGNIMDSSLADLYRSEQAKMIRKNWLNGSKIPDVCRKCRNYSPYTFGMLKETRIEANQ